MVMARREYWNRCLPGSWAARAAWNQAGRPIKVPRNPRGHDRQSHFSSLTPWPVGKQGNIHNMETRKLEYEVQYVTCPHGTMKPRLIRYQFRLGPNMVDEALAPSFSVEIADRLAMVPGLLS